MFNVAAESFPGRVDVVVSDTKFLARLLHNGRDLGVVGLDYAREEVVGRLVVQRPSEHCPEPASCGVVLGSRYLQLSP